MRWKMKRKADREWYVYHSTMLWIMWAVWVVAVLTHSIRGEFQTLLWVFCAFVWFRSAMHYSLVMDRMLKMLDKVTE